MSSKKEVKAKIEKFFSSRHRANEVKKIRRLAMHNQIKLGDFRKKFCKKCFSMDLRVKSVRKGLKNVECKDCGFIGRYRMMS